MYDSKDFFDEGYFRFTNDLTKSESYGNFENIFLNDEPIKLEIKHDDPVLSQYFDGKNFWFTRNLYKYVLWRVLYALVGKVAHVQGPCQSDNFCPINPLSTRVLHAAENIMHTETKYITFRHTPDNYNKTSALDLMRNLQLFAKTTVCRTNAQMFWWYP